MGGRCALAVAADGRAALEQLSRSAVRGEADRARVVLWPLAGETSAAIAARLDVQAEQVWRGGPAGGPGGGAAVRGRPPAGRAPRQPGGGRAPAPRALAR